MIVDAFTYTEYRRLLAHLTDCQYEFAWFDEAAARLQTGRPFILLRHDIDMCLEAARRMAEVEADCRIVATYFFLLRTEHYNLFSKEGAETARSILDLGHALGLHFDCAAYADGCDVDTLAAACRREAGILEAWFGRPVSVVSYHRPNALVLSGEPELSRPRLHTYMEIFRAPITYLSDSRGQWSRGSPTTTTAFRDARPLHVLVHPVWWDDNVASPEARLAAFRRRRVAALDGSLARNCTIYRPGPAVR